MTLDKYISINYLYIMDKRNSVRDSKCPECLKEMIWDKEAHCWECVDHGLFEDDRDEEDFINLDQSYE